MSDSRTGGNTKIRIRPRIAMRVYLALFGALYGAILVANVIGALLDGHFLAIPLAVPFLLGLWLVWRMFSLEVLGTDTELRVRGYLHVWSVRRSEVEGFDTGWATPSGTAIFLVLGGGKKYELSATRHLRTLPWGRERLEAELMALEGWMRQS